jgi:hypothetical protein
MPSPCFPPTVCDKVPSFPWTGFPGWFARCTGTTRTLRLLPPVSRAHCVRFAIPAPRLALRSLQFKAHLRRAWGLMVRRHPDRFLETLETAELPGSWGTLVTVRVGLGPRWDRHARPCGVPTRPPLVSTARAPDEQETFEARCPRFPSGCLRFVGWVAPSLRKTRFRLLASSTGRDSHPQGSEGRFPSCSRYISSPFPRLTLAQ